MSSTTLSATCPVMPGRAPQRRAGERCASDPVQAARNSWSPGAAGSRQISTVGREICSGTASRSGCFILGLFFDGKGPLAQRLKLMARRHDISTGPRRAGATLRFFPSFGPLRGVSGFRASSAVSDSHDRDSGPFLFLCIACITCDAEPKQRHFKHDRCARAHPGDPQLGRRRGRSGSRTADRSRPSCLSGRRRNIRLGGSTISAARQVSRAAESIIRGSPSRG